MRLFSILLLLLFSLFFNAEISAQKRKKSSKITLQQQQDSEYYFLEGVKDFTLEAYKNALTGFLNAYEITPDAAGVNYMLAKTYLKLDDADKAEKFGKRALELDDQNKYYYLELAQIYQINKKSEEAEKVFQKLLKKLPNAQQYQYELAELYISQKKYQDAIGVYDKIEEYFGKSEDLLLQKQQLYLKQNKISQALEVGNDLIDLYPDELRYKLQQAELLINCKKIDEGQKLLQNIISQNPTEPYSRLLLYEVYKMKGQNEDAMRQLEVAFKNVSLDIDSKVSILFGYFNSIQRDENIKKMALDLGKSMIETHPKEAKSYSIYGDIHFLSGNKNEALSNYLRATKLDESKPKIWQQVVSLEAETNAMDSLVIHANKAVELFPSQPIFWFYLGVAHFQKKNYQESAKALERGKKLAMFSKENKDMVLQFYSQLGDVYNNLKEYNKSDEAFEEILKADPQNDHAMNNYSYYLSLRKEKLDEARKWGKRLIERNPDEATYLDTYGWILYVSQNYSEALIYLEKAAKNSENGTITEHYGDVLFRLGKIEEAVQQWKKAKNQGETTDLIDKKISDKKLYE